MGCRVPMPGLRSQRRVAERGERFACWTCLVVVPDRKGSMFVSLVTRFVAPGSEIITDGHDGYKNLPFL